MNFPQLDCPDGQGKDIWFRISSNYSQLPCEPLASYVVVSLFISLGFFLLACGNLLGLVLLPASVKGVHRHFFLNTLYLSVAILIIWLGLTVPGFVSSGSAAQPYPLIIWSVLWIMYYTAVVQHFQEMQKLAGSLMLGSTATTSATTPLRTQSASHLKRRSGASNGGGGAYAVAFATGLQKRLGDNTWLDNSLFKGIWVQILVLAVLMWIVLPLAPHMVDDAAWYAQGGSLWQKDFIVSLGVWCIHLIGSTIIGSAVFTIWKIRTYIVTHVHDRAQTMNLLGEDLETNHAEMAWRLQLTTLRKKLDGITIFSLLAFSLGSVLMICMSVEALLGMRWWAVLLTMSAMLGQGNFVLTVHFPTKQLHRVTGRVGIFATAHATAAANAATAGQSDNSKLVVLVDGGASMRTQRESMQEVPT